ELADAADRCNEYSVAWIDQLAAGAAAGRGVLLAANHAGDGEAASANGAAKLSVPFELPVSALNGASLRAFNAVFLAAKSRKAGTRRSGWQGYFYPLDAVGHWNRLYGPRGLFQHQSVIPADAAPRVIPDMLAATRKAGQSSFLTVLKRFGDVASPGLLSFPRPGYTLTLDFPNRGQRTLSLLAELDRMTVDAGGAVNPYKDARMSAATFAASFPQWDKLEALRDPVAMSDFWRRTAKAL
ncbi:MAG: hypothetical protein KDA41_14455, partial [Planctomycetales bacterium]|nr:hypothetical protein [Planctomycetales bacterium]